MPRFTLNRCALTAGQRFVALAGITACLAASTVNAAGQSSTNFVMKADTVNSGVANMTSVNFVLASSVGDGVAGGTITSASFVLNGGFRVAVGESVAMRTLLSVVSRKLHGATPFDITVDHLAPIAGAITVEPRAIGGGHTIVFRFDGAVTSVSAVTAMDAVLAAVGSATVTTSGNDAIVTLSGVPDKKRVTIKLTGVNGNGTVMAPMGFLLGDVDNSRSITSADVSAVRARTGQAAQLQTFRYDLNATGIISAAEVSAIKARPQVVLP